MAEVDVKIVAIALILAVTYGTFLFLNANANMNEIKASPINESEYDTPEQGSFFDQLDAIGQMQTDNPEIFFINTMLFGVIAFLLVFVGLRFARGTG